MTLPEEYTTIYFKVTKVSDTLNLAILHLTKLAHTNFSDSINLSIVINAFYRFNFAKIMKTLKSLNLVYLVTLRYHVLFSGQ